MGNETAEEEEEGEGEEEEERQGGWTPPCSPCWDPDCMQQRSVKVVIEKLTATYSSSRKKLRISADLTAFLVAIPNVKSLDLWSGITLGLNSTPN